MVTPSSQTHTGSNTTAILGGGEEGTKGSKKKEQDPGGSAAGGGGGGRVTKLKPTSVARVPRVLPPTSPHALCPSIDLITPPSRHLPPPPSFSALSSLPPAPRHPSPTIGHVSTRTQALPHAPVVLFYLARGGGWGGFGLDCLVLLMARTPMH